MTATCIVLNGPSSSGKSSIAAVLQELWPGPLQVTGLDTFLAAQSRPFFAGDGRTVAGLQRALSAANTLWVGVHCPVPVAEQRERERGDRTVGTVRGQYAVVHAHRTYDLDVDTSAATPRECAEAILAALESLTSDRRGSLLPAGEQ